MNYKNEPRCLTPIAHKNELWCLTPIAHFCLVLVVCLFLGHSTVWAAQPSTADSGTAKASNERLTIAVASDLHLTVGKRTGPVVTPLLRLNTDIVDAFFYDVTQQNADLLLLCGDITDYGGEEAHRTLVQKLRAVKNKGLQTYVIPGNHDLTKGEADQFASLYGEFGYTDAYSRDTDSLSYSILKDNLLILMLDTDGYTQRTNGAYLSEITLNWIEEQLKEAARKKLEVLVAGHYSLLTGQTTEFHGKEAVLALFKRYKVPLYLCGHLHQRNITSADGLTELVVDQVIAYPCSYALLSKMGTNEYRYQPQKVDVSAWARATKQTTPELLNFEEYQEQVFEDRCEETIRLLKGKQYLSKKKTAQTIEFFKQVQREYLEGTLPAHKKEILKSPGYKAFMKIADGTTYGRWIPTFIEKASPYTTGFVLKDNKGHFYMD